MDADDAEPVGHADDAVELSELGERRFEIAEGGVPEQARLPAPARVALLLLAFALAAAGVWWGQRDDQAHQAQLLACVTRGDAAVADADRRVTAISNYVIASVSADMENETRSSIFAIIAQTAARTIPPLAAARDACSAVPVRPWARGQGTARTAYLTYLDGVLSAQRAVADRGQSVYAPRLDLADKRAVAERALHRASIT